MKEKTPRPSPRPVLTRESWIGRARKVLVESGIDDVKVDQLARAMKVTRGSFYWHFRDREDLLDALINDWEARNYLEIGQVRTRWARSEPDLTEIVMIWVGEDPFFPVFDMAVRVWGRKAPATAQAVARVDAGWIALLKELFLKSNIDETESLVRARVAYFHQIGYYAIGMTEDISERVRLVPYYYHVLTGHSPPSELTERLKKLISGEMTVGKIRRRKTSTGKAAAKPPLSGAARAANA